VERVLRNCDPALQRAWHALCRDDEATREPSSHRLLGEPWVVYRTPGGEVVVFRDVCPHRRAPLSRGTCEGDALRCGYHGWLYDPDGACVEIPALGPDAAITPRAHLSAPAGILESHGMVFIAPLTPLTPRPTLRAAHDPAFVRGDLPVMVTRGSAGLLADNFLDMAHFAFVHASTFGAGEEREVPNYHVQRDGLSFTATYEHQFANREDPGVEQGIRPLLQTRRLTYRYIAPFHLELDIHFVDAGGSNVIGFFLAPEDDDHVRIYSTLWRDDLGRSADRMAEAVKFEIAVVDEDLALQSRFDRLELPLDLDAEIHTRADRTTLELRRILAELVTVASA